MTNLNIKSKSRGFTIVELLVVIVVIGILAAITIVSYTGVTARANTASAQAAANAFIQKAEAYSADQSTGYPATFATLTGASSDKIYALSGVAMLTAAPTSAAANNAITYYKNCTGGGISVGYWNYSDGVINYLQTGSVTGGSKTSSGTCTIATT